MFFIPECGEIFDNIKANIEEHGGMVVDQHECFTYQIKPQEAKMKMKDYYAGMIYQSTWINDAIENNADNTNDIGGMKMLQNKDDHLLIQNEKENCKKLNIGKKKQFTIVEGIKLF